MVLPHHPLPCAECEKEEEKKVKYLANVVKKKLMETTVCEKVLKQLQ